MPDGHPSGIFMLHDVGQPHPSAHGRSGRFCTLVATGSTACTASLSPSPDVPRTMSTRTGPGVEILSSRRCPGATESGVQYAAITASSSCERWSLVRDDEVALVGVADTVVHTEAAVRSRHGCSRDERSYERHLVWIPRRQRPPDPAATALVRREVTDLVRPVLAAEDVVPHGELGQDIVLGVIRPAALPADMHVVAVGISGIEQELRLPGPRAPRLLGPAELDP